MRWFRRPQPPLSEAEALRQEALNHLVARFPSEYLALANDRINAIPNGGSRLPWRYRRQFIAALDIAECDLILNHPSEWEAITDVLRLRYATPEDIIGPDA